MSSDDITGAPAQYENESCASPEAEPSIATLSSREVYRNRWLSLREDAILRSNGKKGLYGYVVKDDCAIILPIDRDRLWLVEQYRYTIGERVLELPQGGWERGGVDPEELARGELREETGISAGRMTSLGSLWIAYGFTRQKMHVFLAEELSRGKSSPDPEEHDIRVHELSIRRFQQMIFEGAIRDDCTIAAWGLYRNWLELRGER
jgi:8-oxo-dGTP pyrophosphatase MutT (NUDIX family)